jgi:putative tryptophan/tyrosine transport system substrate-binding protein
MNRRTLLCGLGLGLLATPPAVEAQQAGKVYRIGVLSLAVGPTPRSESFRTGLRELGYVEGQNLVIEYRRAAGKIERLSELAADLVRANVDVVFATGTEPTLAARQVIKTIPVVFVAASPVERGFVASLGRPGTNMTGVTLAVGLAKHLQLLKETVPRISRVAYFYTPIPEDSAFMAKSLATLDGDAREIGMRIDGFPVRELGEVEHAFSEFTRTGTNGLLVESASLLLRVRERICMLSLQQRLPAMGRGREFADAGCLVSYGENLEDVYRRAARYVDRILKGAKPADLPVEQPTKFELIINLKTAKALGLTIPPSLLLRADQAIE